jgi:acyl-CoA thioesterase-1
LNELILLAEGAARRAWLAQCSRLALLGAAALAAPVQVLGANAPAPAARQTLLVVGDSLSAEYGLPRGTGWVALLEKRLRRDGLPWQVVNASISGDTTSGGRTRIAALLKKHRPAVVIIELGGNDALRGLPITQTQANLRAMTRAAKAAGARVLIAGMQVPPNYGRKYSDDFAASFAKVARDEGVALLPFLLTGVADVPEAESLFQPDRIHPRAAAHPRMLDNVWAPLLPLLR